jgi:hypothetical protein
MGAFCGFPTRAEMDLTRFLTLEQQKAALDIGGEIERETATATGGGPPVSISMLKQSRLASVPEKKPRANGESIINVG